jgi:hypothetical protein
MFRRWNGKLCHLTPGTCFAPTGDTHERFVKAVRDELKQSHEILPKCPDIK